MMDDKDIIKTNVCENYEEIAEHIANEAANEFMEEFALINGELFFSGKAIPCEQLADIIWNMYIDNQEYYSTQNDFIYYAVTDRADSEIDDMIWTGVE